MESAFAQPNMASFFEGYNNTAQEPTKATQGDLKMVAVKPCIHDSSLAMDLDALDMQQSPTTHQQSRLFQSYFENTNSDRSNNFQNQLHDQLQQFDNDNTSTKYTRVTSEALHGSEVTSHFYHSVFQIVKRGTPHIVFDPINNQPLKAATLTDKGIKIAAAKVSEKYNIHIESLQNTQRVDNFLLQSLEESLQTLGFGEARGIVFQDGENTHATPIIIAKESNGSCTVLMLDSIGIQPWHTLGQEIEGLANTGVAVYNILEPRQTSMSSCGHDAINLLKAALVQMQVQGLDSVLTNEIRDQILTKNSDLSSPRNSVHSIHLPMSWSKDVERPTTPLFIRKDSKNAEQQHFSAKNRSFKPAKRHTEQYTKTVRLESTDSLDRETSTGNQFNLSSFEAGYRLLRQMTVCVA